MVWYVSTAAAQRARSGDATTTAKRSAMLADSTSNYTGYESDIFFMYTYTFHAHR